jgi:hypothetical protein
MNIPLKARNELGCSGRVISSCSINVTRRWWVTKTSDIVGIILFIYMFNAAWVRAQLCKLHPKFDSQVIKFTSCLPMIGGSLRVLRLLPSLGYQNFRHSWYYPVHIYVVVRVKESKCICAGLCFYLHRNYISIVFFALFVLNATFSNISAISW